MAKKLLEKAKTYLAQKFDIFSWDFATFIAIKNGVFDLQADLQPLWFTFHITEMRKNSMILHVSQLSEIQGKLKFIYSEKATELCKIFTLLSTGIGQK